MPFLSKTVHHIAQRVERLAHILFYARGHAFVLLNAHADDASYNDARRAARAEFS